MSSDLPVRRTPLPGGVVVTLSAALTTSVGFAAVYVLNRGLVPVVLIAASAAGIGLVAGLIARWSLTERGTATTWLVALVGICFGMAFIGWISQGKLGFDPQVAGRSLPDWPGLGQLAMAAIASWLAVRAWRKPRREGPSWMTPLEAGMSSTAPSSAPSTAPETSVRAWPGPVRETPRITTSIPVRRTRRVKRARLGRSSSAIRLSAATEHLCPYCLSPVDPRDARGVVTCEVCHTMHHADCWGVTGTCQVPHHN